jgi:hypothetical protein
VFAEVGQFLLLVTGGSGEDPADLAGGGEHDGGLAAGHGHVRGDAAVEISSERELL